MKNGGPPRLWSALLLLIAGHLSIPLVYCQQSRGDTAALGFDGIVERHDGYVKGETPTIPQTSFSCSAQPYNPGLYADMETNCQVYHVCFEDRQESFLCGPGTNFNQRILACDFWYNFNCQDSPSFYGINADIGKVPDAVYRPDQRRTQQPTYPQRPEQPPSGGSFPTRVSLPPPPSQPQQPSRPQRPSEPQPPSFQPPSFQPQPEPPRIQPQPPRIQPQPPRIQPQPPRVQPQPPRFQPPPPPPRPRPEPPRFQPQPQPPAFRPQPRPEPPRSQIGVKPEYPRIPQPSGQPTKVKPPQTHVQQEEDNGYDFGGYRPPRPISVSPPRTTPRPVFPPVVSPPRVSRPPLTPAVIRQPEISRPRVPVTATRPEHHPDSNIKGNTDYRPPQPPPRIPQPSRPISTGYPGYPVPQRPVIQRTPRPAQRPPSKPVYQPPPAIQQEHVETEYIPPPPPPPRPSQPSRPSTAYVPPPPIQQEIDYSKPPQKPPRPAYVPPPVAQKPDYGRPQPPVAPSVVSQQQKPAIPPPSRPQVAVVARPVQPDTPQPPQRPRPVFPIPSDHPNSNIKGGPGYQQPPPKPPRFEPTRIGRPSSPPESSRPPIASIAVKPASDKRPVAAGSGGYNQPQPGRIKKPSDPPRTVYQPPIPVIDHPSSEIKGSAYEEPPVPQQPQRIKRPQQQVQRPRAPIVVSRPQPPSLPSSNVKTASPSDKQVYEKSQPPAGRIKSPSQPSRISQPRFPQHVDHPSANIKGGSGYDEPRPEPQPVEIVHTGRPSSPPSSPSIVYEQKTTASHGRGTGSGYPSPPQRRDDLQPIVQPSYRPQRIPQPNTIPTSRKVPQERSGIKDSASYPRPPSASTNTIHAKQPNADYGTGSSYTRGPDVYPKPEFGQSNIPYQPSRSNQLPKPGPSSQNVITQNQVKPAYQASPASSGSGRQVRPDYPYREVPGHQPPYQRQVFPVRENPDHPNESIKGSGAYRPPPPAGFQSAASEVQEQQAIPQPEPEPSASRLGDTGSE